MRVFEGWRRGQDSNLQGLSPGGFQDRFLTIRIPLRPKSLKSIGYVERSIKTATRRVQHTLTRPKVPEAGGWSAFAIRGIQSRYDA